MRDYLIRLAIKYSGDYFKIEKAIKNNEAVSKNVPLQQAITIIDNDLRKNIERLFYNIWINLSLLFCVILVWRQW